jgi:hypothetical protein
VPGLRLLLRSAPFIVGVLAAAVWLHRRAPERRQLEPPKPPAAPPKPPAARFASEPIDIVTVVDDLLDARP